MFSKKLFLISSLIFAVIIIITGSFYCASYGSSSGISISDTEKVGGAVIEGGANRNGDGENGADETDGSDDEGSGSDYSGEIKVWETDEEDRDDKKGGDGKKKRESNKTPVGSNVCGANLSSDWWWPFSFWS
ncbi:hypothetical protein C9890_0556 [Perkinsus sp. BL_2016]|nr:hypothetical protein C9890_0556 [Perkinsus sp. BL_2016]